MNDQPTFHRAQLNASYLLRIRSPGPFRGLGSPGTQHYAWSAGYPKKRVSEMPRQQFTVGVAPCLSLQIEAQ